MPEKRRGGIRTDTGRFISVRFTEKGARGAAGARQAVFRRRPQARYFPASRRKRTDVTGCDLALPAFCLGESVFESSRNSGP